MMFDRAEKVNSASPEKLEAGIRAAYAVKTNPAVPVPASVEKLISILAQLLEKTPGYDLGPRVNLIKKLKRG